MVKLFTETRELKRYVGMKAEIGATHDHSVARSISNQPVSLIQGEHTRAAGCVDYVRRAMQIHEIRYPVGQHGSAASGDT